ncbi:hypothetical protein IB238_01890 [Rhizobium sp. ARZ01]|uniref:hypothetical protein n=1 Tax=Rhizobium sp. ARZ01 TaxID=2769313 RepID=UPI0017851B73|nr:hypothetical protein [Rhizobium sp. ARZ01]MBD9371390.1 hypothetical protein [Rhizobium sp. ARZ01]
MQNADYIIIRSDTVPARGAFLYESVVVPQPRGLNDHALPEGIDTETTQRYIPEEKCDTRGLLEYRGYKHAREHTKTDSEFSFQEGERRNFLSRISINVLRPLGAAFSFFLFLQTSIFYRAQSLQQFLSEAFSGHLKSASPTKYTTTDLISILGVFNGNEPCRSMKHATMPNEA